MRRALWIIAALALALMASLSTRQALRADGTWLDQPLMNWNTPGMAVPAAPESNRETVDPRCRQNERDAETDEDAAVQSAGWALAGSYQADWGSKIILGTAGYDGMCRPIDYQVFVFSQGWFAGTLSPQPMASRTDGAAGPATLAPPGDSITVTFLRYADRDPLCCPSRSTFVTYKIVVDDATGLPVLNPMRAETNRNSPNGG